jgi:short subunit dehydrogenase-like uncharacterized protein
LPLPENGRELDVVVFGATGVTGCQVARYLAGTDARWGAAGRDAAKLERTLTEVDATPTATIAADLADPASLVDMAKRAGVVLNLVGPYTTRARPVIEACVAAGAHYADLTGEIPFVREMVDEFDAAAREAGVKVVQVCGFEALPPDLGVLLAAQTARERWGEELSEVNASVAVKGPPGMPRASDMISGGTFQSMAEVMGHPDAACLTDPAALIGDPNTAQAVRSRSPITLRPRTDPRGAVVGPMMPSAFINPAVIQRTAELDARERGLTLQPFRYREGVALGGPPLTLPLRYGAAGALAGVQAGMRAMIRTRPRVRDRLADGMRSLLPSSGFGPDVDRLEPWRWRVTVDARTTGGKELGVDVEAEGHPGYLATARMLGEAGLIMAGDGLAPQRAGCLTPALALGTDHLDRFERARMSFSVG